MWHKREAEWEREKIAREKLMAEVLRLLQMCTRASKYDHLILLQVMAERQQQINRKLDILKAQQVCSIVCHNYDCLFTWTCTVK